MEQSKIDELEERLKLLEGSISNSKQRVKRKPSAYNEFMRSEFNEIKQSLKEGDKIDNQAILKQIAKKWKELKETADDVPDKTETNTTKTSKTSKSTTKLDTVPVTKPITKSSIPKTPRKTNSKKTE